LSPGCRKSHSERGRKFCQRILIIVVEEKERGVTVTMNRPEKLNASNAKMVAELLALLAERASRKDTRALGLTGAGRVFSSGADIGLDGLGAGGFVADCYPRVGDLEDQLESAEIPTVAAINGLCLGGGPELGKESCVSREAGSGMDGTLGWRQN
jgi:enoyl-CoA hydratase/carnithine racemase